MVSIFSPSALNAGIALDTAAAAGAIHVEISLSMLPRPSVIDQSPPSFISSLAIELMPSMIDRKPGATSSKYFLSWF